MEIDQYFRLTKFTHMKQFQNLLVILLAGLLGSCTQPSPLTLHQQNPHYFHFHGKPMLLIGSTEHYGAVMNLDFDYIKYLDELALSGLNVTRTFSGVYVEPQGAFDIEKNTLAPAPERFCCPWKRSKEAGYTNGGNKFDLSEWDKAYFHRLRDFVAEAGKRNIIVELDLFSNYYDTVQWKLSPLFIHNNINGIGNISDHKEVLSLKHPEIIEVQEKMVRKIINELKDFDNLYYEICNEPYFGDTTALESWEKYMTDVVIDAEKEFRYRHLISQNIANGYRIINNPHPGVSIFNFHYAKPPCTVTMNYHLNKVIGDNETGFDGVEDIPYRTEAWDFMLAGGGLFNHLDYSFTADHEDGSFIFPVSQPGGGGKALRKQFKVLADFMNDLDFISMTPDSSVVIMIQPKSISVRSLIKKDELYAFYLHHTDNGNLSSSEQPADTDSILIIDIPKGSHKITWINPNTATESDSMINNHPGGNVTLRLPHFPEDMALKVMMQRED
jgi:hypothetical protein